MLSVSKFLCDYIVVFEFLVDKCLVKSQVSRLTLLEGFYDSNVFYCFPCLLMDPFNMSSMSSSKYISVFNNANSISCYVTSGVNNTRSSLLWKFRLGHVDYHVI